MSNCPHSIIEWHTWRENGNPKGDWECCTCNQRFAPVATVPLSVNEQARQLLNRHYDYPSQKLQFKACLDDIASALNEAATAALEQVAQWQPIETAPKDKTVVLVALIKDGKVWRVSEASFNGLGWYDIGGKACHWRTHWMPLPQPPP